MAKRAGTGLLPIFWRQASELVARPRFALKPTPKEVFLGESAIIVVIRLPPLANICPEDSLPGLEVFTSD
jgi:hypothetical protein